MRKRASSFVIAFLLGLFLVGSSFAPAGAANPENLGSFVGAAGSHALKITIGDLVLTVGGGESRAGYDRIKHSPIHVEGKIAKASAKGVVIPGLADTGVSCAAPDKLNDSVAALELPSELAPLVTAKIGTASCDLAMGELPKADHSAGEVLAEVRLTQEVVNSVPAVNEFLDTLQGELTPLPSSVRDQANSVIDAIQAQLSSQPLVKISVAPNSGTVTSTNTGIGSVSPGSALTIDVLGGVLKVEVAVARAAASIENGKPTASADVAWAHVKALNILTPDPDDALIDQNITAPQDLSILDGTPLATSIATERGITSTACEGKLSSYDACASSTADALALSLLAAPLPNIGVELVHTEVLSAGNFDTPAIKKTSTTLPKTGAGAAGVVAVGIALALGGFGLRRRLLG
jgi:LPXTG-motif cell wall-anchored protein